MHVRIPYEQLGGHWNAKHPFPQLLPKTLSSKSYTTSWDGDWDIQNEIASQN